jgi:hypothetical protein
MSVTGRTNVDILFHDMDGTSAIRIVSVVSSDSQTTGKVALVSGTHSSASHTIAKNSTGYKDASGSEVSLTNVTRIGLRASRPMTLATHGNAVIIRSDADRVAFSDASMTSGNLTLTPLYTSGTGSYTVFLYGT